ncbi:RsiV family protein [uncultured Tyzzerella sp.]|uniref:RsiV family protein n=1 Tax=uncultured Tyzzerella sp. TaxID=2321398 RepID=UPI0029437949|nr:RsiV family protein [uncultured Tyzzerella sp.]
MEHRKIIEDLKKEYNNINVKQEGVFIMKKRIEEAKRENKNKKIKYVSVASIAAIATFVALPNLSPNIAMAMGKIPIIGKIVNVVTMNKYDEQDKNITAKTPVASDESSTQNLEKFNKEVDEYIKNLTEEFKKDFQVGANQSLDIDYDVITDTEKMFSLRINGTETKASGFTFSKIYNIDKKTGEMVELKDLFKEGSNYIDILSENIKQQMKEQMANDDSKAYFIDKDMEDSNFTKIREDQNFYFDKDDNLVIAFDEYEVAPGYMGEVEFVIENNLIKDILK